MPYDLIVRPPAERIEALRLARAASLRETPFNFQGVRQPLPVVRVRHDVPIYRMENGRTQTAQLTYVSENDLLADYFEASEEDITAQRIQHDILVRLSKDSAAPIYDVLARAGRQEEELVITASGVIVNGNRRLAAIRELWAGDRDGNAGFEYVEAILLPASASPNDLALIETELQMQPRTLQEYTWIDSRLKMRRDMERHDQTVEQIARQRRIRDKAVKRQLYELDLVDEYLAWRGTPRNYASVLKNEQNFTDLSKTTESVTGPRLEIAKYVAFNIIAESRNLGTRSYQYGVAAGSKLNQVSHRLKQTLGIDDQPGAAPAEIAIDPNDPLAAVGAATSPADEALLDALKNSANTPTTALQIATLVKAIEAEEEVEESRAHALENCTEAHTLLSQVSLADANPEHFGGVRDQLASIVTVAQRLIREIDAIPGRRTARISRQ